MHGKGGGVVRSGRAVGTAALLLLTAGWPVCHAAVSTEARDGDPRLTETELRWLQAVWPVLLFARDAGLPVDVVVQPQLAPELPPLALA